MSLPGTSRYSRDVRLESANRAKPDIRPDLLDRLAAFFEIRVYLGSLWRALRRADWGRLDSRRDSRRCPKNSGGAPTAFKLQSAGLQSVPRPIVVNT
jgi:hypothetical protein